MPCVFKHNKDIFVRVVVSMNISYQQPSCMSLLQLGKNHVTTAWAWPPAESLCSLRMLQKSASVVTRDFTWDFAGFKREEETLGKEARFLARNFLQSGLGLGVLSQYNQKSLSILNVYTKTVERKRKGAERKDKKNRRTALYLHSEVSFSSYVTLWWKKMSMLTFFPLPKAMYVFIGRENGIF